MLRMAEAVVYREWDQALRVVGESGLGACFYLCKLLKYYPIKKKNMLMYLFYNFVIKPN